ncbi:hypothetical protein [Nocardia tengchongensis]|uniref:hypothetical protein n=1 Tax=Nocardia tengchongensis TaxID=2055889 RepID=UPI0036915729
MNFEVVGAGLPMSHLAAAALGLGVVGVSDVTVVVSDEFADTVAELTGNPDRGIDLRSGFFSRTIVTPTGTAIVLNAPELGCTSTSFMERLLAHEAGRVLLEQRGECLAAPERLAGTSAWERLLRQIGGIAIEEYRIERTLVGLGYPEMDGAEAEYIGEMMLGLNAEIVGAVTDVDQVHCTTGEFEERVLRTHAWLAKYLAYIAAYQPDDPDRIHLDAGAWENWIDYISGCWDQRVGLYESVPSIFEPMADTDLELIQRQGLALEVAQLEALGFSYTTEPGGRERLSRRGSDLLFTNRLARLRADQGSPANPTH